MKKILLSVIALTMLAGSLGSAEAQHHHRRHRVCYYRHGHRVCRFR